MLYDYFIYKHICLSLWYGIEKRSEYQRPEHKKKKKIEKYK